MTRLGGALISLVLVATACSDTGSATTTTTVAPTVPSSTVAPTTSSSLATTTTTEPPEVFDGFVTGLSDGPCLGIGDDLFYGGWEITFVRDEKLWGVSDDGGEARCILEVVPDGFAQAWNAPGDRLITGRGGGVGAVDPSGPLPIAAPARFEGYSWTRPTGTSIVGIGEDNRLLKYPIDGSEPVDLSFLARHDEVNYHPAGTHVLVVGEAADGEYGIWLATNLGTEPELLVDAGNGVTVSEPVISHDGLFLYFIAYHEDERHFHELFLPDGFDNEFDASIGVSTDKDLSTIVTSPWAGEVVLAEGLCGGGIHTVVPWSERILMPERENIPIGFLPDVPTKVLVAAWDGVCRADVAPDLYLVSVFDEAPPELVVRGVSQFALPGVRSPFPEPPPPPGEFDFETFA